MINCLRQYLGRFRLSLWFVDLISTFKVSGFYLLLLLSISGCECTGLKFKLKGMDCLTKISQCRLDFLSNDGAIRLNG